MCVSLQATEDFRATFAEAAKRGDKKIIIPPGTYRLAPEGNGKVVWTIQNLQDTEIVAEGVTLISTKLTRAVALDRCSRVTLRGLTVDYDPLPFTQGAVTGVSPDLDWIEVTLHAGYPRQPYSRIDVIDPATRYRQKGMPFLWGTKAEMQGENVVRVSLKGIGKAAKVGNLASLSTGPGRDGIPHAMSIERCEGINLTKVTINSAPGMGILEGDGGGRSFYRECRVVPGPKPEGANEERLLSTSWDAIQTKTVRKGPWIEKCEIRDAGDDSWSVQSADFMVLKVSGPTLVIGSRDEFTIGVDVGDRLCAGLDKDLSTVRTRKNVSREEAQLDTSILAKLTDAKSWSEWHVSPRCIEVTLDKELSVQPGDSVFSPDRMGNGFAFINNRIHSPGRILIKAAGLIQGNILDTPHALTVCPELPAAAAFGIDGLTISQNTIRRAGWFCQAPWSASAGALSMTIGAKPPKLRPAGMFMNVLIENNTFEECSGPNLVISSARDVTVRGNRFIRPLQDTPPETGASYQIAKDSIIWINESEDVRLEKNEITDPGSHVREAIHIGSETKNVQRDR